MVSKKAIGVVLVPQEIIEKKIFLIRGKKVMLDRDLAQMYDVKSIRLREQVKRNKRRFPGDFMFQLDRKEAETLVSQNAIPSLRSFGGYLPYVFTEQGVAMLSSILNSDRAIDVNIAIMRVFVRLKEMIFNHKDLAFKLRELENKLEKHDGEIQAIFEAIRDLMEPPPAKRKSKIGFH
jgi:hypothetical protein